MIHLTQFLIGIKNEVLELKLITLDLFNKQIKKNFTESFNFITTLLMFTYVFYFLMLNPGQTKSENIHQV